MEGLASTALGSWQARRAGIKYLRKLTESPVASAVDRSSRFDAGAFSRLFDEEIDRQGHRLTSAEGWPRKFEG
jgi:hypothetical protein